MTQKLQLPRYGEMEKKYDACTRAAIAAEIPVALCQSCLRARPFANYIEAHAFLCPCGEGAENYCFCEGCVETVELLQAGERDRVALGLQPGPEVLAWSAQDGMVEAGA